MKSCANILVSLIFKSLFWSLYLKIGFSSSFNVEHKTANMPMYAESLITHNYVNWDRFLHQTIARQYPGAPDFSDDFTFSDDNL